LPIEHVAY